MRKGFFTKDMQPDVMARSLVAFIPALGIWSTGAMAVSGMEHALKFTSGLSGVQYYLPIRHRQFLPLQAMVELIREDCEVCHVPCNETLFIHNGKDWVEIWLTHQTIRAMRIHAMPKGVTTSIQRVLTGLR